MNEYSDHPVATLLSEIEAESMEEAVNHAKTVYPNRALRISDGQSAVELRLWKD